VCELELELTGNNAVGKTFMQVDGDAWVRTQALKKS
jgi:hypothetical protein